jgi:amino acid adenylation domain-containing protein
MKRMNYSEKQRIAANQNLKERNYWLNKLVGEWEKTGFPYDFTKNRFASDSAGAMADVLFKFPDTLNHKLMNISGGNDYTLHIILTGGVVKLLSKYNNGKKDIVLAAPIYKQEVESDFINTMLALRSRFDGCMKFKELLVQLRETLREAVEHQNYPMEVLAEKLNLPSSETDFPLFEVAALLENVHEKKYLRQERIPYHLIFSFRRVNDRGVEGTVEYNPSFYRETTIERLVSHLERLLENALSDVNIPLSHIDILSEAERKQLLVDFNDTAADYPDDKTLYQLFEEQVEKTPHDIAVIEMDGRQHLTYDQLNRKANQLSRYLRKKGVGPDKVVGIMMDNTLEMIISILGVLKAGGAYLPFDPALPEKRIITLLNDSGASVFLSKEKLMRRFRFISFKNFEQGRIKKIITPKRPQVMELDTLQIPDRSLVDYEKYHPFIGQSMVKNSITVQFSRGCIFKCLYCFKIWPDKYSLRTGENLFEEVNMYYKLGIRRFGFTDDLPNFNKKEISKFYRLVIKNKLKIHLHFPNGIRGDVLTPEFIDLMMEAGAVTMDLALETASPRLQKLIRKNVNIERLRKNVEYIITNYPHAILGVQIMHGFPTETEEEARASLEFIKSFRWLPFGYMHILKIYPNTAMARFAMEHGITEEDILKSMELGYHELPYTLRFPESFTRQCQAEYLGDFFLNHERLKSVLPYQMSMLTEDELVQKYNSYLPVDIKTFSDLLNYIGLPGDEIKGEFLPEDYGRVENFNEKVRQYFPVHKSGPGATRVLLLDLSQHFTDEGSEMYHVVDPPLGLMYLLTYLNKTFGSQITGKIAKSQVDFDKYDELKELLDNFKPDIIGVRTLTYFKNFFHKALSMIRQWGFHGPIISGGPYATSSFDTMLQDVNVDVAVREEGEITMAELMTAIISNGGKLPDESVLKSIPGIAFVGQKEKTMQGRMNREVLLLERMMDVLPGESDQNPEPVYHPDDLAYIIYTSGSTGMPKGVMVQHRNVVNQLIGLRRNFSLDASFNYLLLAAYTFDVSVMHMFSAVTTGAKIFMIMEDVKKDPLKLWPFIHENDINILNIVPAFMKVLLENIEKDKIRFKYLFVGGDVFQPGLYASLRETFKADVIINIYGPTETTINAAFYICGGSENGGRIPIGKPVMNYKAYILDEDLNPVPIGGYGEIYISGTGVTRGYLNRPHLTVDKFVPNPFVEGETMYRSGDHARWLPDGNIDFMGRVDHQVKIRGFRIELEEIEKRLTAMEHIKEAVVLVKEDDSGDKYLTAYITACREMVTAEMKACLVEELPDYMIPTYFIQVDKMPLKSSGKIDTRALRETKLKVKGEYVPPTTDMEKGLARIWSEVLGIDEKAISTAANFFDLGGHSLKATILISKIHKAYDINIPLIELFKAPTIKKLAQYIQNNSRRDSYTAIEPAKKKEYYALSPAQRRLYILKEMESESTSYNISMARLLEGELQVKKFEETFMNLIDRYESLRTSFELVDEEPVQKIHDNVAFAVEYHDSSFQSARDLVRDFIRPFDLSLAPLIRVGLIKVESKQHVLMVDMHHIITDGVSQRILIEDFLALYGGARLSPLRLQYKDYSEWMRTRLMQNAIKQQEEYWLRTFTGEIPVLNLPTDYARPAVRSFAGHAAAFTMDKEETWALNELARSEGVTLFMVLLAIYNIFLAKISGREEIVVGTPVAGRRHADLEKIIGMFVNTLVLWNSPSGWKTFKDFLAEVKEKTLDAFENEDYPFEELVEKVSVERDTSRSPLFDVMFAMQHVADAVGETPGTTGQAMVGMEVKAFSYGYRTAKFDITLDIVESKEKLYLVFEYCIRLFRHETIERFIQYFRRISSAVLENPGRRIAGLEIITEEEKKRLLFDFNDTAAGYQRDKTIHELFEEQAEKTPLNTAVVGVVPEKQLLSYRELNEKSNQLARRLRAKGVKTGGIVGIMVERSPEMMIGIMAVLKAGGAYLPIAVDYPLDRIAYMLDDSDAALVLAKKKNLTGNPVETSRLLDLEDARLFNGSNDNLTDTGTGPGSPVYVIYTSGSTGRPKGVMIEHGSLVNRINWMQKSYPLDKKDTVLHKTSFTFDVSVWEIFWWSTVGARVCLLSPGGEKDPRVIIDTAAENDVTVMHFVPSMLSVFLEYLQEEGGVEKLSGLKQVIASGEALTVSQVKRFKNILFKKNFTGLANLYGPTEATIDVTYYNCFEEDDLEAIPIGKPIDNTRLYILDENLHLQPVGTAGELCIAGDGLARGYLNNPGLSADTFVVNPFDGKERIYRTRDLARWLPGGTIEFLGRIDQQVKVRGFRVEPGELETHLLSHGDIKEAVVVCRSDESGENHLCAYFVSNTGSEPSPSELREHLLKSVPAYMVPSYFTRLSQMPLNPNGKIDRKALPAPEAAVGDEYTAPGTEVEKAVAQLWADILKIDKDTVSVNANFFQLGGHSLKATVLAMRLHKKFNVKISLADIFKTPVLKHLARYIANDAAVNKYTAIEKVEERAYYPLSSVQKRMYVAQQIDKEGTSYNMQTVVVLKGELDKKKLGDTFKRLIKRHESLRTSFIMLVDGPVQEIHDDVEFEIEYHDMETEERSAIENIIRGAVKPFVLSHAPLLKVGLIKITEIEHILMVDMHHIVSDANSLEILAKELISMYNGKNLPPLKIQYRDFSEWQRRLFESGEIKKQEKFWLDGFKDGIPELNLPTDYPRPSIRRIDHGDHIGFVLEEQVSLKLLEMVKKIDVTVFIALLAVYNVFLFKYTKDEDIVVGSPVTGRTHNDLQNVIGAFLNMIPMRNHPRQDLTFSEFLKDVKRTTIEAFDNQDYQFEELVTALGLQGDASRNPLFDTEFSLVRTDASQEKEDIRGLTLVPYPDGSRFAKFDLHFHVSVYGELIHVLMRYSTDLFKRTTVEKIRDYYLEVLHQVIENMDVRLGDITVSHQRMEVKVSVMEDSSADFVL